MRSFVDNFGGIALGLGLFLSAMAAHADDVATIRRISMLEGSSVELEIAGSGPLKPEARVIKGPNRLVLDFPGTVPAKGLHNLDINRGDVMDARVGLFSSNPPITRVVLDLKSAQAYQLFPSGNTVVVKFGDTAHQVVPARAAANPPAERSDDSPETIVSIERSPISAGIPGKPATPAPQTYTAVAPPVQAPLQAPVQAAVQPPRMQVSFENGLLSIHSNKANLSEVLSEVHRRTGAEITIPPGAESEQVFTSLGPGAPKEVLASLLNGSHFNFIVIGSERDPGGLRRVVLTPKQGGATEAVVYPCGSIQPAVVQAAPDPGPPVQAFEPPMPPEQSDPAEPQPQQAPPPQQ